MRNYLILQEIVLSAQNQPTGNTKHFKGQEELPTPHSLKIVRYPDDLGYYLLYFDEQGNELTDTYHEQLEDAVSQAEWEFSVSAEQWTMVQEDETVLFTETDSDRTSDAQADIESSTKRDMIERIRRKLGNNASQE